MQITAVTQHGQIQEFASAMAALGAGHERGVAFALNGVAKDAKAKLTKVLRESIRKRAIERIRCVEFVLTYVLYETTTGITLKNRVRVEMPWHDGTTRAVVGKVIGTKKKWDAEEGGTMQITIGVSVGTGTAGSTPHGHRAPYGPTKNYLWDYVGVADPEPVYGVEGDTEYVIDADALRVPVDARQLSNAGYAVLGPVVKLNEAGDQIHAANGAGLSQRSPSKEIQRRPTYVRVQFRDLGSDVPFERQIFIAGEMLTTDMGIDLTGGDDL
ncbi:hypothetical protein [Devosia sp. MC521]|uniref:hypothetical protein n=1 Tax=Devosia sp. MC521 TaxID=2759954 RepID=UPI0015FB1369|nr:hypothetical protein [Devosia sp. MC521]MBJ6986055.1 hypothetical protein [Devosia sp. MC521]QMW61425.1 hypothetical protein H4N61_10565 [Devosia sp. MC521]